MASKTKPRGWKTTLAACAFLGIATESGAQSSEAKMNGAGFLSACSRPGPEWIGFCHGYVQAWPTTAGRGFLPACGHHEGSDCWRRSRAIDGDAGFERSERRFGHSTGVAAKILLPTLNRAPHDTFVRSIFPQS
jgi:hypothetical protein